MTTARVESGGETAGQGSDADTDTDTDTGAGTAPHDELGDGETARVALGAIVGARSGDKGGNANLGVWVRTAEQFGWLEGYLTVERLAELLPFTAGLKVERFELPNLLALNFVVHGLLGRGVAASPRLDAQAKALGEELRAGLADIPRRLLRAG